MKGCQIGSLELEADRELGRRLRETRWRRDGCQKTYAGERSVIGGDHPRGQEGREFVQAQRLAVLMHGERGQAGIHARWSA